MPERVLERGLRNLRGKAVGLRLAALELAVRVGQLTDHIIAHIAAPQREARHVRHEAPFHFHDGAARIRMDDADVGAGHDLEPAAEGDAVHSGDHRHRQFPPAPGDMLGKVRNAVAAAAKAAGGAFALFLAIARLGHRGEVEPCAEGAAFAGQHHGAQAFGFAQHVDGLGDAGEHQVVEGIHLVGPDQADIGHAVVEHRDGNAVFHGNSSVWMKAGPLTRRSSSLAG